MGKPQLLALQESGVDILAGVACPHLPHETLDDTIVPFVLIKFMRPISVYCGDLIGTSRLALDDYTSPRPPLKSLFRKLPVKVGDQI